MPRCRYVFHRYSFDPAARELRLDGALIALPASTFDCLTWLIEHRDRAVGRDELIAAVWGRADISDSQLVQLLLKARRAVGDSGDEQHVIRTIPRFGYRWVAPVEVIELPAEEVPTTANVSTPIGIGPPGDSHAVSTPTRSPIPLQLWLLALAAVCIVSWLLWRSTPTMESGSGAHADNPAEPHIPASISAPDATAVLPAVVDAPAEWEWLRLGLMELVANRLSRAGVAVVPSENVMIATRSGHGEQGPAATHVLATLGATRVIQPRVRAVRGKWQVLLTASGSSGESRDVEAEASDPTTAAHQSAIQLLAALGVNVLEQQTSSADDALLRARALMLAGDFVNARAQLTSVPEPVQASPEARLLAVEIDHAAARYAEARSGAQALLIQMAQSEDAMMRARTLNALGASEILLGLPDEAELTFSLALDEMGESAEPALRAQAYLGRGVAHALRDHHQPAIADFGRARIELTSTGDSLALARLSLNEGALQGDRGHPAQALDSFRDAARHFERLGALDQLASALANQAKAHLELMEYSNAMALTQRITSMSADRSRPASREVLVPTQAMTLIANGRLQQARTLLEDVGNDDGPRLRVLAAAMLAEVEFESGQPAAALSQAAFVFEQGLDTLPTDIAARLWLVQLRSRLRLGDLAAASSDVERFGRWADNRPNRAIALRLAIARAELAHAQTQDTQAMTYYASAMQLADTPAVPADIADVASSWGTSLIDQGELDQARAVIGRIARWADQDFDCAVAQALLYQALKQPDALKTALAQAVSLAGDRPLPRQLSAR